MSLLLSKTRFLPSGIQIKPDMTPEEQLIEWVLFKERWALTQKETDCRAIKIHGNRIFMNNKLYGEVINSGFILNQASSSNEQMESSHNWLDSEVAPCPNQSDNQTSPFTVEPLPSVDSSILTVININFRSVLNKRAGLIYLIHSIHPDIIIGTETWLAANITNNEIIPPELNYNIYHNDRKDGYSGVLIAVSMKFTSVHEPQFQTSCELV